MTKVTSVLRLHNKSIKTNNKETNNNTILAKTNHTIEIIKYNTRHIILAMIQEIIPIIKPKCALFIVNTSSYIIVHLRLNCQLKQH